MDVGHYAAERGVISASGAPEFEYNRALALDVGTELEKLQIKVRLIGERLRSAGFAPSRYHADPVIGESRPFADEANGVHYYENLAVGCANA